jgi:hypothetical protein
MFLISEELAHLTLANMIRSPLTFDYNNVCNFYIFEKYVNVSIYDCVQFLKYGKVKNLYNIRSFQIPISLCHRLIRLQNSIYIEDVISKNFNVKPINPPPWFSVAGHFNESLAINYLETAFNLQIIKTEHIINPRIPYLICSVDGLLYDSNGKPQTVIEIKSPMAGNQMNILEVVQKKLINCIDYNVTNQIYTLKNSSKEYCQLMLSMALLNVNHGTLIFYSRFDNSILKFDLYLDYDFVNSALRILEHVYFNYVFPFICNNLQ